MTSESVTHIESRGEVEEVIAVVAPNTVLIEETITLQPPLSCQDARLSYGHESRLNISYIDPARHFRPITDGGDLVERVNCENNDNNSDDDNNNNNHDPVRNQVNRIDVNKENNLLIPPISPPRKNVDSRRKRPLPPLPPVPINDIGVPINKLFEIIELRKVKNESLGGCAGEEQDEVKKVVQDHVEAKDNGDPFANNDWQNQLPTIGEEEENDV